MRSKAAEKLAKDIETLCDAGWTFDPGFRERLRKIYARHEVFLPKKVETTGLVLLEYRVFAPWGEHPLFLQTEDYATEVAAESPEQIVFPYYGEDL